MYGCILAKPHRLCVPQIAAADERRCVLNDQLKFYAAGSAQPGQVPRRHLPCAARACAKSAALANLWESRCRVSERLQPPLRKRRKQRGADRQDLVIEVVSRIM